MHTHFDEMGEFPQGLDTDTTHVEEIIGTREGSPLVSVVQDSPGETGADARQALKGPGVGPVEIEAPVPKGALVNRGKGHGRIGGWGDGCSPYAEEVDDVAKAKKNSENGQDPSLCGCECHGSPNGRRTYGTSC